MSTAPSGAATGVIVARIMRAAPVISAAVSPRTRSAIRKAPISAGLASPAVMTSSARRISSSSRLLPSASFWIRGLSAVADMARSRPLARAGGVPAPRRHAGKLEEVGEQRVALLGGDALGVELHAVHGVRLVHEPHDQAVRGLGRDLEAAGQAFPLDDERMIARHLEAIRQPLEDAFAGVV